MGQYRAWLEAYGAAFLDAAAWTLGVAVASFACALLWGAILFFLRLNGGTWGVRAVDAYVQLLRNTPVLLPIYLIYFGFPLFGLVWPAAICGPRPPCACSRPRTAKPRSTASRSPTSPPSSKQSC